MDKFTKSCEEFFFTSGVVLVSVIVVIPWVIGWINIAKWGASKGGQ